MARKSLRAHLIALVDQHPDWTARQYAEVLGQTPDAIRGALSALRRARRIDKPADVESNRPKPKRKRPAKIAAPILYASASGRFASNQTGYLKLL